MLAHVAADVFDDPLHAEATREFLADARHRLCVALDAGTVVGFVSAVLHVHPDKPRPDLFINEVGVAPSHQRRGIASSMLEAMLRVAREAGCSEAWVLTDRTNEAAMGLYASSGGEIAPGAQIMFTFPLTRTP